MNVSPLKIHINPADIPLEQLNGNSHIDEQQKINEVSRQFEAVLLRQILSEAQKPAFRSKFTDTSVTAGIYQDMTTSNLAEAISRSGHLGLAASLNQQLSRQVKHHE